MDNFEQIKLSIKQIINMFVMRGSVNSTKRFKPKLDSVRYVVYLLYNECTCPPTYRQYCHKSSM